MIELDTHSIAPFVNPANAEHRRRRCQVTANVSYLFTLST
jgi:hypothetical protein